jgi:uncharacterized protein
MTITPLCERAADGVDAERITRSPAARVARPVMLQGWYNLTSLHWQYPAAEIQALLPHCFTVDTFDGSAWVGLIPFEMKRIRLPVGPNGGISAGRFSSFPEINVRTYIRDAQGRRAVWFFSLDIDRVAPTIIARVGYGLPYCVSKITVESTGDTVRYRSKRTWLNSYQRTSDAEIDYRNVREAANKSVPGCDIAIRIGDALGNDQNDLHDFVSARWALGSTFARRGVWAEVDHPPWPLFHAEVVRCDETLMQAAGLKPPRHPPIALWSPGVEVRIGRPHLLKKS